jgi:hypothetical protein
VDTDNVLSSGLTRAQAKPVILVSLAFTAQRYHQTLGEDDSTRE